jgi:hypothetical protein
MQQQTLQPFAPRRYHAITWEQVSPRLADKPAEHLAWLKKNTRPLAEQLAN